MSAVSNFQDFFFDNSLPAGPSREEMDPILAVLQTPPTSNDAAGKAHQYRVLPHQGYDLRNAEDMRALSKALERIKKQYPREYMQYRALNGITPENFPTKGHVLAFFAKVLHGGCCSGTVNSLFHKIYHTKSSVSLEESARDLDYEDIFFRQILELMRVDIHIGSSEECVGPRALAITERKVTEKFDNGLKAISPEEEPAYRRRHELSIEKLRMAQSPHSPSNVLGFVRDSLFTMFWSHDTSKANTNEYVHEYEQVKEDLKSRYQESLEHIQTDHYYRTFPISSNFLTESSAKTYQKTLEKVMSQFDAENFVGAIRIPGHVIAFQCGKDGYFLYDSYSVHTGLFAYPDKETFFENMRELVLKEVEQDVNETIRKEHPEAGEEEIAQRVVEKMAESPMFFSVQPLGQENPVDAAAQAS